MNSTSLSSVFRLALAASATLLFPLSAAHGAVSGYAHQVAFTPSGYRGSAELQDYPLLFRLSEDIEGFSYADILSYGADIRFALADGTPLDHEVDTWDPAGTSYIWVRVPKFSRDTQIVLHYGKAGDTPLSASGVWSDYIGVWHLGEVGDSYADSTGHGLTGTNYGTVPQAGRFGGGRRISTTDVGAGQTPGNRIETPTYTDHAPGGNYTISTWFKYQAGKPLETCVLLSNQLVWYGGGSWYIGLSDAFDGNIYYPLDVKSAGVGNQFHTVGNVIDGQWYLLTAVYDYDYTAKKMNISLYKNGTLFQTAQYDSFLSDDGIYPLTMGGNREGYSFTEYSFPGTLDEVRFRSGTLSADWIQADYDSSDITRQFLSCYGRYCHNVVPPGTPGVVPTPPYLTRDTAATNIQDAVDIALPGELVRVWAGTYPLYETLQLTNADVVVQSYSAAKRGIDPENTILDAGYPDRSIRAVRITNCTLDGVTVCNAHFDKAVTGTGIYADVYDPAHPVTLANCIVSNNVNAAEGSFGGGFGSGYGLGWVGTITNCRFIANTAAKGGGLYTFSGNALIAGCDFDRNIALSSSVDCSAAGAYIHVQGTVRDCRFRGNIASAPGGIYGGALMAGDYSVVDGCLFENTVNEVSGGYGGTLQSGNGTIVSNCVFRGNAGVYGIVNPAGTLFVDNVFTQNVGRLLWHGNATFRDCLVADNLNGVDFSFSAGDLVFENCTIANNAGPAVEFATTGATRSTSFVNCILSGNWAGQGEIAGEDAAASLSFTNCSAKDFDLAAYGTGNFTANPLFVDPANGDYHLRGGSRCRDAGVALDWMSGATDLDGANPRILYDAVDLGCYEHVRLWNFSLILVD